MRLTPSQIASASPQSIQPAKTSPPRPPPRAWEKRCTPRSRHLAPPSPPRVGPSRQSRPCEPSRRGRQVRERRPGRLEFHRRLLELSGLPRERLGLEDPPGGKALPGGVAA